MLAQTEEVCMYNEAKPVFSFLFIYYELQAYIGLIFSVYPPLERVCIFFKKN